MLVYRRVTIFKHLLTILNLLGFGTRARDFQLFPTDLLRLDSLGVSDGFFSHSWARSHESARQALHGITIPKAR